ncbi:F-box only protein 15 [Heterocephalus glaber]|uniref:F-box only protein 15 n=1 Tax=Heterocephalus glaber TaxID=10181 RepID=G5BAQ4_HETGA|nr:F-box only protein 15 [Heterocephalus glaber]
MATGRGPPPWHRLQGLREPREPLRGGGAAWGTTGAAAGRTGASRFRKGRGVKFGAGDTALRQYARRGQHFEKSPSNCSVYLDRMPSEILLKIFSYLDAVSLLCVGCVNRRFYHLANDKPRWYSLIAQYDLSQLTESTMIGCDRIIRIFSLSPGLVVGLWKSCSFMDVTLLDEHRKPFWCLSSAVYMRPAVCPSDGPHFLGQTYYIDYKDVEGRVHAELVWIEETEEYFIVSLVLYLSVAKINHWFGTKY